MKYIISGIVLLVAPLVGSAASFDSTRIGLRGGLGTDIGGSIAYGIGANYMLDINNSPLELGLLVFGGRFTETTERSIHTYNEVNNLLLFAIMANYLVNYLPEKSSTFFLAGVGLASVSVDWEESSPTDTSLGTPLAGGGSKQSEEGSGGGAVFNIGVGRTFSNALDARLEVPVIVTFSGPEKASSVIPTVMLTLGYRFN